MVKSPDNNSPNSESQTENPNYYKVFPFLNAGHQALLNPYSSNREITAAINEQVRNLKQTIAYAEQIIKKDPTQEIQQQQVIAQEKAAIKKLVNFLRNLR